MYWSSTKSKAYSALWVSELSEFCRPIRPRHEAALPTDELELAAQLLDVAPAPLEVDPLELGALEAGLGVGPVDELQVLPRAPRLPALADVPQLDDDVEVRVNS